MVLPFQCFDWYGQNGLAVRCRQLVPAEQQSGWGGIYELHWRIAERSHASRQRFEAENRVPRSADESMRRFVRHD